MKGQGNDLEFQFTLPGQRFIEVTQDGRAARFKQAMATI